MNRFDFYLKKGVVKKQSPDIERAKSLVKESERKQKQIEKVVNIIGIDGENANDLVEDCYDVIIGLVRALMLSNGFNSSGKGAHEAEVYFLEKLDFDPADIEFINQLRYFRKGILYYGKKFDKEYACKTIDFMNKLRFKLKKILGSL